MEDNKALSVFEAVSLLKAHIQQVPRLVVRGEVSGFRGPNARSGHMYFDVKDEQASMSVIVWRNIANDLDFELRDGLEIELEGAFDLYAPSGKVSFQARCLRASGEGLLRQQVAALARKLQHEGLLDDTRKQHVPVFCNRICVVTSLSGSVIDDVKRTLARRNPLVELLLVNCQVQGKSAAPTIINALRIADKAAVDAILLVRGGGSLEDLMCFNDEALARAIASLTTPIVTGIGHEPDTTIADMVADRRTSTPTAAAESIAPAMSEILQQTDQRQIRLTKAFEHMLDAAEHEQDYYTERLSRAALQRLAGAESLLDNLATRPCLMSPTASFEVALRDLLQTEQRLVDSAPRNLQAHTLWVKQLHAGLVRAGSQSLERYEQNQRQIARALDALSPLKVLARGYSIVSNTAGKPLQSVADVAVDENLEVRMADGSLAVRVQDVQSAV